MSNFKIFDIAASGMSAQNLRLNLVASNMANIESVSSSLGETYKARQPVFRTIMDATDPSNVGQGVEMAGVVESKAPLRKEYQPGHPMADEEGYIYKPNVNAVEEMANMISASRAYQSNVEIVNSARQMMSATLNIGK